MYVITVQLSILRPQEQIKFKIQYTEIRNQNIHVVIFKYWLNSSKVAQITLVFHSFTPVIIQQHREFSQNILYVKKWNTCIKRVKNRTLANAFSQILEKAVYNRASNILISQTPYKWTL